eukprot:TRINITY_DN2193_c1_g1_i2.p1 TRINITY_DN2193_c1_g1~~TRINITY_DN2193_c1_g1_i2.p1  ORF type:complete len:105 (-),score=58.79 TRINITY_DN2193_c1_g1_i2:61-375(-)
MCIRDRREATEQLRRNKWQAAKEKEIKEITIKGLEPEIQRMLASHKKDLAAAAEAHEEAVRVMRQQSEPVSYTHLRAHETVLDLVCRLLLEKKKNTKYNKPINR